LRPSSVGTARGFSKPDEEGVREREAGELEVDLAACVG
jgi:hypothetical protein